MEIFNNYIIMGTGIGCIGVLDTQTLEYTYNYPSHNAKIISIQLTSKKQIQVISEDDEVRLWN